MKIEKVTVEDAEELLEIYAPYVENTAITFEYDVPSKDEFEERIKNISAKYPYIKAVHEGKIVGYAYAASFKDRRAYDWSVETTIYVKNNCKRMGIGKVLYEVLEQELKDMGILNMNACIARPVQEGRYLNDDSIRFHDNMGFTEVGHFHNSGYKFGQWFDMILTGKTAIVTGGSGTLCSAMAYGLAVSGAKTAIIGRNQEKLLKVVNKLTEDALNEYGKDVIVKGYSCNVTDKNELEKAYSLISSELGTCDILINGAGGNQPGAIASTEMLKKEKGKDDYSFWNLDEDKIRDVMDVNYMGTLLPIQVFYLIRMEVILQEQER